MLNVKKKTDETHRAQTLNIRNRSVLSQTCEIALPLQCYHTGGNFGGANLYYYIWLSIN